MIELELDDALPETEPVLGKDELFETPGTDLSALDDDAPEEPS